MRRINDMNHTHCPHCGKPLEQEAKRPQGCCCDTGEWDNPFDIPPVCAEFQGADTALRCTRCEHDFGCHINKTERN